MNAALLGAVWLWLAAHSVGADQARQLPTIDSVRAVLSAIVEAGRANADKPPRQRVEGDALTNLYIRAAAQAALKIPESQAAGAFLLALGVGLDDSTVLRGNPLTSRFCRQVESDAERRVRLRVLGKPTMRARRDWTQHFVVSCFLTALAGPELAEAAGILKEQLDSQPGGSGFSFADLSADLAGVAFARRLEQGDLSLKKLAADFVVKDYLPDAGDLREGLSAEAFARDYGSLSDERFKKEVSALRQRVEALPGFRKE